jgi:hypothetical protein
MNFPRRASYSLLLFFVLGAGCQKKKEETPPIPPPPPRGAASLDQLTTGLGLAKGLDAKLAPPSMRVEHVYVLDDKRVILSGGVAGGEAIALMTLDAGKTWKSYRTDQETWATWAFGSEDGVFGLALGPKETLAESQPAAGKTPPALPPYQFFFATLDALSFGTATNVDQPPLPRKIDPKVPILRPRLALLTKDMASYVAEPSAKKFVARYVVSPGTDVPPEVVLPKLETFIPNPIGRPARLLSIKGRGIISRKWPEPDKPVVPEKDAEYINEKIKDLKTTPTFVRELSMPPACQTNTVELYRITQPPTKQNPIKNYLLVVKPDGYNLTPMPAAASPDVRIGCANDKFIVEAPDGDNVTLLLCPFEGACTTPERPVFKPWLEKHEREIIARPTASGGAAVMSAQGGERWGVYYAQSTDGGKFYERARVIGEGSGERGRVRFGALVTMGKRTLLLLSADVTGTSRRGFYTIASDDDGATWNPP